MPREIHLDGAEISIIKALGVGSGESSGKTLISRLADVMEAELIDTLKGLMSVGYVECDHQSLHDIEDVEKAHFHVNPGYSKDLKEALNPSAHDKPKSKRVRRE